MPALCRYFHECSETHSSSLQKGADLMVRLSARDDVAFRSLVENYQSVIYSFTYALTGNDDEADGLAQKVFVRAYKQSTQRNPSMPALTWLYRMSFEECIFQDRIRALTRIKTTVCNLFTRPPTEAEESSNQPTKIRQGLRTLSMKTRAVLLLRDVAGQSVSDLVEITATDAGTIRKRLLSARLRLLKNMRTELKRI